MGTVKQKKTRRSAEYAIWDRQWEEEKTQKDSDWDCSSLQMSDRWLS